MTSWLSKKKKQELLELGSEAGMKPDESLKKDDLIDSIDEYLQKNSTKLSNNASFKPYFETRRGSRPRESVSASAVVNEVGEEAKSAVKRVSKKATKVKAEAEYVPPDQVLGRTTTLTHHYSSQAASFLSSPGKAISDLASRISSPLTTRTPASRRVSHLNSVALTTTPSVVAENLERATTKFYAGAEDLYSVSGIPDTIEWTRSSLSSVVGVQASILLLEAYSLQGAVFPWKYAFYISAFKAIGLPGITVKLPDLFILLNASFWGPTLLWAATSIFIPLFFAYFYNLTIHPARRGGARVNIPRYSYDPMTYSIVKGVATLLVYGAHAPYSWIDVPSARIVEHAMFGGYRGILAGCAISGVAALWEAAQR